MDKERIHKAAMGRRAGPSREKRRLIVYAALLGVLLILWMRTRTSDTDLAGATPPPTAPPISPREYEPLAKIDHDLLATVRDGDRVERAVLEPAVHAHLVGEASKLVYGDMEALGVQALPWDELMDDPADHRGQPVAALGRLAWWEPDTSTDPDTFRGELVDAEGRSWLFIVVNLPWNAAVDDVMKAQGFFFKRYDMVRPDLTFASGPLIVGEELLPSAFPIEPVTELRPDLFDGVRDFDLGEASRPLDSPAFFELLSYVQNTDPEKIFGPAGSREPVYAKDLMNDTTRWRGKPVTLRGQLVACQRMPLGPEGENPLGIPFAWQIWMLNYRGGITYAISLEEPVGLKPEEDMVDIDGIYFRRYAYESGRNEPAMAAAVIASRIRKFVIPPDTLKPFIERTVLVAVIALTLLIGIGQWMMRRQGRRARTESVRRKKKLLELPGTLHDRSPGGRPTPRTEGDGADATSGEEDTPRPPPPDEPDTRLGALAPRPSGPS